MLSFYHTTLLLCKGCFVMFVAYPTFLKFTFNFVLKVLSA